MKTKNEWERRRHSLAAKAVHGTVISCLLLGAVALIVGLGFYSYALSRQYIRHGFGVTSHASMSVSRGADSRGLADEVMQVYHGLTPEQRQTVGTQEYRAHFSAIDTGEGSAYSVLTNMLKIFLDTEEIDDVYLAMYDRETSALVYIVDPSAAEPMQAGDWEAVSEKEAIQFLDWDGEGLLYHIGKTEKYGWLCTTGVPIRSLDDGSVRLFVLADISLASLLRGVRGYSLQVAAGVLAVSLLIAWITTRRIRRTLVTPVNAIADAAAAYAQDKRAGAAVTDHFARLPIHTQDEVENLSQVMADMERDLAAHEEQLTRITAEKERIGTELRMASAIQAAMLPHIFPPFPERREFDLYASMDPAKEVGGDFYDFFLIDSDHLCLVMADVSGKGVPAALFMMISKVILQSCAMLGRSAGEILTKTNEAICSNNQTQMFVTVWLGILEISTGKITCANAGHEYPAIKRADGDYALYKDRHGFVIGGMAGMKYKEYELQLNPGDKLFVYTDGVPEATNARKELFGTDRMLAALNAMRSAAPTDTLKGVRRAVDAFVQDAEQFDDLTMLCLEYKGTD